MKTPRLVLAAVLLFASAKLISQGGLFQQQPQRMAALPSITLGINPAQPAPNQTITVTATPRNFVSVAGSPPPRYRFRICSGNVDCLTAPQSVSERGYTTSNTWSFTPTAAGFFSVYSDAQIYRLDGSVSFNPNSKMTFEVKSNTTLTWNSVITEANYGEPVSPPIAGTTIHKIVNSQVSVRSDSKKCNECHYPGGPRAYRGSAGTILPGTSVRRSDTETYRWSQTGPTGIVVRFCETNQMGAGPKPLELRKLFTKWAADGYRE
jgi:hypothetical protein